MYTLTLIGTSNADHFEVNATSVRLGGDKSLAPTNVEFLNINSGDGDDYLRVDKKPTFVSEYYVNLGAGTDSLKIADRTREFYLPSPAPTQEELDNPWMNLLILAAAPKTASIVEKLDLSNLKLPAARPEYLFFLGGAT